MTRRPETLATLISAAAAHGLHICAVESTQHGWRVVTSEVDQASTPAQDQTPPQGAAYFDPTE